MKPENKKAVKDFLGEFAVQGVIALLASISGGIWLAYLFIGWGVLWLLVPFVVLGYWAIRRRFSNISVERDASPQSGSRPSP